ncbi:MAG: serine--tRNA ligase [Alphaproteobacteria bacterium]|nr:serine--tRNA ligase [Alphaproteobacteria bacterium]
MIDLKLVRENPEFFDEALKRRGIENKASIIGSLDQNLRKIQNDLQNLQKERNTLSAQAGILKNQGQDIGVLTKQVTEIKESINNLEKQTVDLEKQLQQILWGIPNIPLADVPNGLDANDNKEIRRIGTPRDFDFSALTHDILGEKLKLMDFQAAAKMSGARFVLLKGDLAKLERALAQFMLDLHTQEFGYLEISPPLLVKEEALFGTSQLPKFAEDLFHTTDDYWLISTAEISLTNIVMDSILDLDDLPLRFTACTPCFRSEAGAAGKDTKGMIRQHQFSKVELVSIVEPEQSFKEHERMTTCAEEVLKRLELPFRTMLLCTGDMGFASQKTYDIEVWLPGQKEYREISSCSNCGDFQARRMKARFRRANEKGTRFVHTLNGSGLAVGRTMIAIIENYQQKDGTILIPSVLQPYMNGKKVINSHV